MTERPERPATVASELKAGKSWTRGDNKPHTVRFVGFPPGVSDFTTGQYVEGTIYEVGKFDGRGEAPFQVVDENGSPLWVNSSGFHVVS
jgi:hypothetical protein